MSDGNEDMVTVVNTMNRRTQKMPRSEAEQFLRKHTLFRLVEEKASEEPKRKVRKVMKKSSKEIKKEEESTRGRKRKGVDASGGPTPRSSPSETSAQEAKRRKGVESEPQPVVLPHRASPLITLSLREMHDIIRLFTSAPAGCVDWQMISESATGGRVPAADIEFAANEFLPAVHYRPSIGQVVMERQSKGQSEYAKYRQTVKRMRQGLVPLLAKLKSHISGEANEPVKEEPQEPMLITPEGSPEEDQPAKKENNVNQSFEKYFASLPAILMEDLKRRAALAICRFEKGETPSYAFRQPPVAVSDGDPNVKVRKRYETKAMRLAKQAVDGNAVALPVPVVVKSEVATPTMSVPPFFHAAARQFAKSSSSSVDNDE